MADLEVITDERGTIVVDLETGEVVEWDYDPGEGPARIAALAAAHRGASEAIAAFERQKRAFGVVLARLTGGNSIKTDGGNVIVVAPGQSKHADPRKVIEAIGAEVLTEDDATDLLIKAAKELDAKAVEAWIDEKLVDAEAAVTWRAQAKAILLTTRPRAGYTRVDPPTHKPPRVEKRTVAGDMEDELSAALAAAGGA